MDATFEAMELLGAGQLFKTREHTSREFWRQIEQGLPQASAEKIISRIPSEARGPWREIIRSEPGNKKLSPAESEKAGRLAYILALAKEVWGTWKAASAFLTHPHEALDGKTPLEATTSEWGSREVEGLLRRIQFGLPA